MQLPPGLDLNTISILGKPVVNPDDKGISHTTIVVTWPFTAIAIIIVLVRMYLRRRFQGKLSSDDWLMLAGAGAQIAYQSVLTKACLWGLGKKFENTSMQEGIESNRYLTISIPLSIIVSLISRLSITILLNSIFGGTKVWFKWLLVIWFGIEFILGVLGGSLALAMQIPIESQWDPRVSPTKTMDPNIQRYTNLTFGFFLALSDLICVVFPVVFIWKLQMPLTRKIGLVLLMGMSIIAFGAAFAKVVVTILALEGQLPGSFMPDFGGLIFLVSSIEQSIVIAMGCIPTLGPITKIKFSALYALGKSLTDLISNGRRSRKSSRDHSLYNEGIDLGPSKRISDDRASQPQGAPSKTRAGGSTKSLITETQITRTDDFTITYNRSH